MYIHVHVYIYHAMTAENLTEAWLLLCSGAEDSDGANSDTDTDTGDSDTGSSGDSGQSPISIFL